MTYLRDNEKKRRRSRLIALFIAVAFLFYFQHAILSFFSRITLAVFAPALSGASAFKENTSNGIFSAFSFKGSLIAENDSLKAKLNESDAKLSDYNRLLIENLELKDLLGRTGSEKLLLSAILAKPNRSPYDTLILDIGEKNNVYPGATVLAYGNIIIGKISEVSDHTSKAVLFSSPGEEYDGLVLGKNTPIKLSGRGGGNFISELPRAVPIAEGDQVYSVGLSPYLLGTVQNISSDPRDPFQTILIKSPVNVTELRFVEVSL